MKTGIVLTLSFLLVASLAFAAGTSTGGVSGKPPKPTANNTTTDTNSPACPPSGGGGGGGNSLTGACSGGGAPITAPLAVRSCEDQTERQARIVCRLQQGKEAAPVVEESCRGVADSEGCQKLYGNSEICYKETGKAKDACFKRVIGFSNSAVRAEASKNQANVRSYVVLLLYDVQERVEDAHEAGTVTDEDAAALIDKIVATKQTILTNAPKSDIKTALADLKTSYQEVMQ